MLWSTVPQQNSMENIEPHGTAAANGEHHNTDDIYGFVTDPSSPYFGPHFVIAPAPLLQADKHNSTTSTASPSSTTTDNFNNSNNNRNNANRGDRRRSNDIRIEFDSDGNLIANPSSTSDDRVLPLLEATSPLWHEIWSTVASGRKMDKIGFQKYKIPLHPEVSCDNRFIPGVIKTLLI